MIRNGVSAVLLMFPHTGWFSCPHPSFIDTECEDILYSYNRGKKVAPKVIIFIRNVALGFISILWTISQSISVHSVSSDSLDSLLVEEVKAVFTFI